MDSIFDNFLPLLLILAYFFSTVFRKKNEEEEAAPTTPSYPSPDDESDSLREEIKRRFQERGDQWEEESDPTYSDEPPAVPVSQPSHLTEDDSHSSEYDSDKAFLLQQARLTELKRQAAEVQRSQPTPANLPYGRAVVHRKYSHANLRKHFRSSQSLSEAIILMEILGPPLSLRKSGEE